MLLVLGSLIWWRIGLKTVAKAQAGIRSGLFAQLEGVVGRTPYAEANLQQILSREKMLAITPEYLSQY